MPIFVKLHDLCISTLYSDFAGFYDFSYCKINSYFRKITIHSPQECLVWVKKCCHVWLDQNFEPSLLTNKLWLIFMGKKHFFFLFLKKKFKIADSKKVHFSKSPILKIFLWKFHGSVLGLVELIDAKGIDLSQPIWLWGCPT